MRLVSLLDNGPVIRQRRHLIPCPHQSGIANRRVRPIRLEVELAVGMSEAVEIVRAAKIRLDVAPQIGFQRLDVAMAALSEGGVDQLARRHFESGMHGVEAAAEALQHVVI